jgi:P2 family phage contractile tail tube protein
MSTIINKVFNSNVYADGGSLYGKADEVSLPTVKAKNSDPHAPLGFVGEIDYAAGFEKMDGVKIKWNSYYADTISKFSNIYKAIKLQVRFNIESYEGNTRVSEQPGVAYLTVRPNDIPGGNFKAKSPVEPESNFSCTYYKLELNGVEIVEIDFEANIYKVAGVDQLANYRANLGI